MKNFLKLLRINHWIKNIFIFLPIFFSGNLLTVDNWLILILSFFALSFVASSIYIINDYRDIESDRLHPEKCKRPLASGNVKPLYAFIIFLFLSLIGLSVAYYCSIQFFIICLIYFIINLSYSFGLKNISILDIMIVALGFNLRIKAGGILSDVELSYWMNIMVFQLSLFMAVAKRRDDILIGEKSGINIRKSLKGYNLPFLDVWLGILSATIIVSYLMYTLSPEVIQRLDTYRLYYTCIFVIAGLMRYMQLVFINKDTSSPIKVLYTDRFIQATLIFWVLSYCIIIYLPNDPIFK